ncbi:hypothetical protein [Streptomyces sp. T12]|uniref:Rv1733c family protein n=1 Tax=unclassified Streptomyces TaxID=2593676 RepID=UPI0027D336D3|nr:hypothetical protein [Streptomyces sp. T12]
MNQYRAALRRRDDVVKAWIVLAVWMVVAVGGTVAGLVTAHATDEAHARQRAERNPVRAVLLADVPIRASAVRSSGDKALAKVGWTAPDGSPRTGRTLVDTGLKAGTGLTVRPRHGSPRTVAARPAAHRRVGPGVGPGGSELGTPDQLKERDPLRKARP